MHSILKLQLLLITAALASGEPVTFNCTFGGFTSDKSLSIQRILPSSIGESHVCEASTPNQQSILFIKAGTTETNTAGTLHVYVSTSDGALQGHVEVFNSVGRSQEFLQLCPADRPPPHERGQKHQIMFSGTPTLSYTADIAYTNQAIDLDTKKRFTLTNERESELFIFEAPKNIESAQLSITVTSESSVSAYLTVSPNCPDVVQKKIGIFGFETESMRLSFSLKGRLTLSGASSPKLKGGKAWYIGVALKRNASTGNTGMAVTLSLKRDFSYTYAGPICFIVLVPLIGGVLIAALALVWFRDEILLVMNQKNELCRVVKPVYNMLRPFKRSLPPGVAVNKNIPVIGLPGVESLPSTSEVIYAMLSPKFWLYWFGHGPKTFSYITITVGSVLLAGSFQFVYGNWYAMADTGNRDICYYNDFCYRVSGSDIPFNLMISNLAYMIHGLILAISVGLLEAEVWVWSKRLAKSTRSQEVPHGHKEIPSHLLECYNISAHMPTLVVPEPGLNCEENEVIYTNAHKRQVSFSIGYAFAWALMFEGLFSLTYYLCPSRMTFQFDTAFMFIIAGIVVLSLYNGLSVRPCKKTKPVDAVKFFLIFIAPLYFFNYLASIRSLPYYDMDPTLQIFFFTFLGIWYILIMIWVGYKMFHSTRPREHILKFTIKVSLFMITIASTLAVLFVFLIVNDISHLFLVCCIVASCLAIFGKVIIVCSSGKITCTWAKIVKGFLYNCGTLGFLSRAVEMFLKFPTTDKGLSPEDSRVLNRECLTLGFYDHHDIWHLLSSFALLMGAFTVMQLSECCEEDRS